MHAWYKHRNDGLQYTQHASRPYSDLTTIWQCLDLKSNKYHIIMSNINKIYTLIIGIAPAVVNQVHQTVLTLHVMFYGCRLLLSCCLLQVMRQAK